MSQNELHDENEIHKEARIINNEEIGTEEEQRSTSTLENLKKYMERLFVYVQVTEFSPTMMDEICTFIPTIPYFPKALKDDIFQAILNLRNIQTKAKKIFQVSSSSRQELDQSSSSTQDGNLESYLELLSEKERSLVDSMASGQKLELARRLAEIHLDSQVSRLDRQLSQLDRQVHCQVAIALDVVSKMYDCMDKVRHTLEMLAGMSQGEQSMESNMGTATKDAVKALMKDYKGPGNWSSEVVTDLVSGSGQLDYQIQVNQGDTNESENQLEKVVQAWEAWIVGAKRWNIVRRPRNSENGLKWMQEKIKNRNLKEMPPPFPDMMGG